MPKAVKEPTLSAMKRDQSLLFTTVPEEDIDHQSPTETAIAKTNEEPKIPRSKQDRPKSLNLKFTNNDFKQSETVTTPFNYKTSVCSTPLTDKYLHGKPQTIFCDSDVMLEDLTHKHEEISESQNSASVNSILSLTENLNKTLPDRNMEEFKAPISNLFLPSTNMLDRKKSLSFLVQNSNKNIFMRYYGLGLTNLNTSDEMSCKQHLYNTITDPMFPVFRSDGLVISKPMYDLCLSKHCELYANEITSELLNCDNLNSVTNTEDWKSLDDFDSELKDSPKRTRDWKEERISSSIGQMKGAKPSLSLPLKPLSTEGAGDFSFSRKNVGVQLTPLMSKLSLVAAMEDRSSGFCSRDTTPMMEYREFGVTPGDKSYSLLRRASLKRMESVEQAEVEEDGFQKNVLFVCGQQDTVLALLLNESAGENEQLIRELVSILSFFKAL